jgi:peroxiredoxin
VIPSFKKLYDDYSAKGLEIVAFHAPEFDHERKLENVEKAVKDLGLKYPIAIDNDFKTWNAYKVRAWPSMFLIDKTGNIRFNYIGEGAYATIEAAVVALLNNK